MDALAEERISTFTQAVKRTFDLAMARLPKESHAHLERAHALVIHRHVFPTDDGKHAQVLSSDGTRWYPVNGHCTCMDASRAPQGLCKHRLAFGLYRRASELLWEGSQGAGTRGEGGRSDPSPLTPSLPHSLPEAPASVNVRLCIDGHECQFTMRDADEARLVERLQALLTRFPQQAKTTSEASVPPAQAQTPGETPICPVHGPLKQSTKAPGTWFCSKKNFDGSYCQSRHPAK